MESPEEQIEMFLVHKFRARDSKLLLAGKRYLAGMRGRLPHGGRLLELPARTLIGQVIYPGLIDPGEFLVIRRRTGKPCVRFFLKLRSSSFGQTLSPICGCLEKACPPSAPMAQI
jgi:hypothetical protein